MKLTTGGAKFAQKISPKAENYYKTELYFTQTITGRKNLLKNKNK